MASMLTKKCPKCGRILTLTPEASKVGVVCPQCKTFIGEKNNKMTEEEVKRFTAAIHELFGKR